MGLLKSVDDVPGIDYYEYRDDDYYGKYTYRAKITMLGMRHLSFSKDLDDLTKRLSSRFNYGYTKSEIILMKQNLPIMSKLLEWKLKAKQDKLSITTRIEYNSLSVFSNDLSCLQTLKSIDPSLLVEYTEVQKSNYAGVKHFVGEPKHKFRVYLKSKRVEEKFPAELSELTKRVNGLYPSPALKHWMTSRSHWSFKWSSASHFIDYDDESTLSYLALMHGDMLGNKYKLEKRPDIV